MERKTDKPSRKIKRKPKTTEQLVAEKAEAIGVPAAQLSQGDYVEVDVPLREPGQVRTNTTLLNRGGTAVARWHRERQLTDLQLKAVEHVQGLWQRAATVRGLVFDPLKVPGSTGGDGLSQQEALDDLRSYADRVPARYWSVFENVCRWDEPAGTAGSSLASNSRAALASARLCVAFVADLIAMWRGL